MRNGNGQGAVARDLQNVVDDTQQLLKTMEAEGGAQLSAARDRVQTSLETTLASARETLGELGNNVRDGARAAATTTDKYVRSNPWRAIGIVGGVALVVGFLAGRR
jgi:ElaB/YqjD/DUF883 family membrane-anchored ribosome-binding protein